MTDPLSTAERLAMIEKLHNEATLMVMDTMKRQQDIRLAPLTLLATGIGAGAALMVAMTTVAAALLKWLSH